MKEITVLRKAKGMTQQRLALLSGISRAKIQEFEAGYKTPDKKEIGIMKKVITGYKGAVIWE